MASARDIAGDPGLVPTGLISSRGPYVGVPPPGRYRALSTHARFERLLGELHAGFGFQRWWPAETPFEVVVGAILTQNTAWTNVERAMDGLRALGPVTPARILRMGDERLREAIRPSGYFNTKAKKLVHASDWYLAVGGLAALRERPLDEVRAELLGVWGVGPETADSILCYAAGRASPIVDTYTRRLLGRHRLCDAEAPYEVMRDWLARHVVSTPFACQEVHALIVRAGYDNCKPSPVCDTCPATTPRGLRGAGGRTDPEHRGGARRG